ncbi:ATP-dependent DNA helicase PIF1 [Kwoniella heveanensis CBS 569]|uniref:ATP-dependent DNA helicase PIF1 n=1 Tax=Kwoniella heveanensis BCC8398 TaxID=1296120 RepID=A0A1B9GYC6_9TREE|nr:ATP-dependent DNA helicase PIF1 [Kwoniella heveanensis BCC8398]OCF45656.1 ATP-dependent DNA helicase PIF1 [Kwoniella heveanensis CBS 569]
MPSLLTSRAGTGSTTYTNGHRSLSRVNSFKREWGDDDEPKAESSLKGSSGVLDWSPSPDRVKRKGNLPPPPSAPPQPKFTSSNPYAAPARSSTFAFTSTSSSPSSTETPAERRRKAMMASFSQNVDPAPSTSSTAPTSAQKPTPSAGSSSHPSSSSASRSHGGSAIPSQNFVSASSKLRDLDTPQVRQELPSLPTLPKRALPWEEEHTLSKKAMTRTGSGGKAKVVSTGPTLNIKQKVTLSAEQQKVLSLVVGEGKNIFFTGSAGTGKSVLLRELIKNLRKKYTTAPDAVAVTASTGIAACNIGGVTLHSFGGVGLAIEKPEILITKLRKNKKAAARWQRTKVLIIDEVSMVDGEMFDKFCKLGQLIRKNPKPFGGIQIVVTGDFFQLPPVTKGGAVPRFCFEAQMWDETIHMSVNLTKVFRQKDQRFVDMLNEMRFGKLTPKSIEAFRSLSRPIDYTDNIEPTELFPRREDVDKSNGTRLKQLNTDGYSYAAIDGGAVTDPVQREKLLANFMAPGFLELKVDAQVMLIKNVDESLVNGSMGKVIGFDWKSNNFDTSGRWDPDAVYQGMDEEEKYKQKKLEEALREKISSGAKPWPVVRFNIPGGGTRDMFVEPDTFKAELPNGEVQASRAQLPLILAWAMSIHKSQGQTLDRVKVDLGKVFEKGQAYVALSRATSLEGLQVLGFTPQKVMAHRKVAIWSETLKDLNV